MLVGTSGSLAGIFTDSDLARLLERRSERSLDEPIDQVMSRNVTTIRSGVLLSDAIGILAERKISELPVLGERDQPIGLLDITDVVALMPGEENTETPKILPFQQNG